MQSQNLQAMVFGQLSQHVGHLINRALQELTAISLSQIDQMNAPSFLLQVLSQTFPHFDFRFGDKMPCRLVKID